MSEEDRAEPSSHLLLPPPLFKNDLNRLSRIQDIFQAVTRKKHEYQQSLLQQQDNNNQYTLQYSHNLHPSNPYETITEKHSNKGILHFSKINKNQIKEKGFHTPKLNHLAESQVNITILPSKNTQDKSVMTQQILQQERDKKYHLSKPRFKSQAAQTCTKRQLEDISQNQIPQFEPSYHPHIRKSMTRNNYQQIPRLLSVSKRVTIKQLVQSIKDLKNRKTNESLQKAVSMLQRRNPFFSKVDRTVAMLLLKIGLIRFKQVRTILYEMDQPHSCFYIILLGKVKLIGGDGMHKICDSGEMLLQQIVLGNHKRREQAFALQRAKIMEDTYLLQIEKKHFVRIENQMMQYGYKQGICQLQTLLTRNNVAKKWLRNKFRQLQKV